MQDNRMIQNFFLYPQKVCWFHIDKKFTDIVSNIPYRERGGSITTPQLQHQSIQLQKKIHVQTGRSYGLAFSYL